MVFPSLSFYYCPSPMVPALWSLNFDYIRYGPSAMAPALYGPTTIILLRSLQLVPSAIGHFAMVFPSLSFYYCPSPMVPALWSLNFDNIRYGPGAMAPVRYGPLVLVLRSLSSYVPICYSHFAMVFPSLSFYYCPSVLWSQHCGPSTLITPALWPQHYGPSAIWFHHC